MTFDLLALAATLATAYALGRKAFKFLDARWEKDRPYWDTVRAALEDNGSVSRASSVPASSCNVVPMRPGPFDWDRDATGF